MSQSREDAIELQWQRKRAIFENLFDFYKANGGVVRQSFRIAEFGVGRWGFARFYNEYVNSVVGIDIADYSRFHPGVEFVVSDGVNIPLADESVDMVVSHSVLEHVEDIDACMKEIDRITKPNGMFFLTISPLYFSSFGAHVYENGVRVENWEHLDPASPLYMTEDPFQGTDAIGSYLNKLTSSEFLAVVGRLPWSILKYLPSYEQKPVPMHARLQDVAPIDLVTKGFRFIGQKNVLPSLER